MTPDEPTSTGHNLPHTMAVDRQGNVYVGDREDKRIQIFDPEGTFLKEWTGIGYPYGLFITPDQHVWMIDGGYDRMGWSTRTSVPKN